MKWFTGCRRMAAQTVMNMLAGMALCMLVLAGCSKDTPVEDPDKPEQPEAPVEVTLTLSASDLVFDAKGGWKEFTIQCPTAWTITGGNAWCQPGATSGSGKSQVKVMVEASMLTEDRNVNLTVKAGTLKAVLAVTQKGVDALTLSKDKFEVEQEGGDITVEVKSNIDYTVTIPTAFSGWLKQSPQSKAMVTKNYRFTVSPNEGTEKREGYIVFAGNALKDTVRVFQARKEEEKSLILSKDACSLSATAQELSVELKTNIDYEVVVPDSVGGWISHLETRAIRTDRLHFSIGENKGNRTRVATIVIKERDGELSDTLQVSQIGQYKVSFITGGKYLSISAMTMGFTSRLKSGNDYKFYIPDTCAWIYPPTFYPNGDLNVHFSLNETSFTRHGIIIVQDKNSALTDTLYITQGTREALLLDGTVYNAPATTICRVVNVRSDIDCEVIIPEEFSGWLSLHKIEEGHIEIYIQTNRSYEIRHGEVTVRDRKSGQTETLHIYQDAWNDAMIWGEKEVYVFVKDRFSFELNPAYEYDFIIPENSHWIELNQVINNASVSFNTMTRNLTPETRHGSILVREKNNGLTDTVHVHQASQIWMNQTTIHAKAQGLDTMLYAKDYYPMGYFGYGKHLVPDESSSWIKLEDYYESCRILISANTGDQERSAEIYLSCPNGQWYDTLHIRQVVAGQELPYLRLSQNKADVKGEGGSVSVTVSTNVEYEVVIPTEVKGWLSQIVTEGNSELRLVAFANEGTAERCADITLRGKNSDVTATLRVCQAGKGQEPGPEPGGKEDFPQSDYALGYQACTGNIEFTVPADWGAVPTYEVYTTMGTETLGHEQWLSISINGVEGENSAIYGPAGKNTITFKATKNIRHITRKASILITYYAEHTTKTHTINITQAPSEDENIADRFDRSFAQKLQERHYIQDAIYITQEEVNQIVDLGSFYSDTLTSLRGIEYFKALKRLSCPHCKLDELNVSQNTELVELECYGNQLTTLDVSNNTKLKKLSCQNNLLVALDVSRNKDLAELSCQDNRLAQLEIDENRQLQNLACQNNRLTALNVNNCAALTTLYCGNNQLKELEVNNCTALVNLSCENNLMTSLNTSSCTSLTTLRCEGNQIAALNISNCTALTTLHCQDNRITELDANHCTKLETLGCKNNYLTTLEVRNCLKLKSLDCQSNQLTGLDVDDCTELTNLSCQDNRLSSLGIKNCVVLTNLDCYNNQLTELDLNHCRELVYLHCHDNQLAVLKVNNCTKLFRVSCRGNFLTALDVSGCAKLEELWCQRNQLTTLDISGCTKLTELDCYGNQLTTLDISRNTMLTELECYGNQLTTLDVSECTKLTSLHCSENPGDGETSFPLKTWTPGKKPESLQSSDSWWKYNGKVITITYQ